MRTPSHPKRRSGLIDAGVVAMVVLVLCLAMSPAAGAARQESVDPTKEPATGVAVPPTVISEKPTEPPAKPTETSPAEPTKAPPAVATEAPITVDPTVAVAAEPTASPLGLLAVRNYTCPLGADPTLGLADLDVLCATTDGFKFTAWYGGASHSMVTGDVSSLPYPISGLAEWTDVPAGDWAMPVSRPRQQRSLTTRGVGVV